MFTFELFLQIWGGFFYLFAKILLAFSEGKNDSKNLRIIGWISYLIGIPAWVITLAGKNNWLVAAIDPGSIPSMILGILTAGKQNNNSYKPLAIFAKFFTFAAIVLGTSYSIYCFHGITAFSQVLEILVTIGFLWGSYLLAKNKPSGWLLFALMCSSMALLLFMQGKMIMAILQSISLIIIAIGFIRSIKK